MAPTGSGNSEFNLRSHRLPGVSNPKLALRRSPRLLGKSALRRSRRLLGKSAMPTPKQSQTAPSKRTSKGKYAMTMRESPKGHAKDSDVTDHKLTSSSSSDSPAIETRFVDIQTVMRSHREHEAQNFKKMYTYRDYPKEKRTCIHPNDQFDWDDKSSGITWVAVRGSNSTCVVFRKNLEHNKDRLGSYLVYSKPGITFNFIAVTLISEIEVLADLPCESYQTSIRGVHVDVPFAIVSVDPSNPDGDEENVDKDAAVEYLKGILKKGKEIYYSGAKKIAVHAFQVLCKQKLEPRDIWVAAACYADEVTLRSTEIKYLLDKFQPGDK